MHFNELDKNLRIYETLNDTFVLPGIYMVARIDGRTFTRLTRDVHKFEAPYDERFRDCMIGTVQHLLDCGFRVVFGYTQSDEISLLFHIDENGFARKVRKYTSVLAGEASAKFSLLLGDVGAFDCRISQLPTLDLVLDYFRWRSEDAHRNALNSHCYWTLRKQDHTAKQATQTLSGLSVAEKNELLFQRANVNFNDLPAWQRRGIGLYKQKISIQGKNPINDEFTDATRRQTKVDLELPLKEEFTSMLRKLILHSECEI